MTVIDVNDCIRLNLPHTPVPPGGLLAGYTTGSGGVPWTADDFKRHPDAVRICQDPAGSDATADIFDVEPHAGTLDRVAGWVKRAQASFHDAKRPGQRAPAVYMSQSNVTNVVNALIAGGITKGVGLWIAHFGATRITAQHLVETASGPFPIIGFQYANGVTFDRSVFDHTWIHTRAGTPPPPHPPSGFLVGKQPPGRWSGSVTVIGKGPDGHHLWLTHTQDGHNWTKPHRI